MTAISALLLFAGWTLVLMAIYIGYRTTLVFSGRKPADSWTRGAEDPVPGFVRRAQNAHMNCVENLPVFGAIVLSAAALGRLPAVDSLAPLVLWARIAQSATHLLGVNHWMVIVRATFFTIQVALFVTMIARLLS
jgi:uncharacterized MAPEG superfamily protein